MNNIFFIKKHSLLIVSFLFLTFMSCGQKKHLDSTTGDTLSGKVRISGSFALYPMMVKWAETFKILHPDVSFDISGGGAGKGMTDVLNEMVDVGMVSREIYSQEVENGAFCILVAKDAVVPIVNVANPELKAILSIGLRKEIARKLWNEKIKTWGAVLGTSSKTCVHVFTRSDACGAAETWASWFNARQEDLKATSIFGDPGIADAIQKDKFGIGYNNISYAYNRKTKKLNEGLAIIPLDVNGNGKIDPEESFYETMESLITAINDGRYPSPPARYLYLVTKGKPTSPTLISFLKYILSEGQKYEVETGYIGLSQNELDKEIEKIK
ncbi:MAG: phosphate ABC transporter substrate-binding protein [Candidatus Azobacteroides pseudotrichonymphae]|jgi:phosphate transport system substrate-binding protein|nr:MAG: phosphate ABC transporter substrate-binding protein [Candidatus Azobacteroides pseudotrichonymphae]